VALIVSLLTANSVCELDIMFNLEKAHMILDEMVRRARIDELFVPSPTPRLPLPPPPHPLSFALVCSLLCNLPSALRMYSRPRSYPAGGQRGGVRREQSDGARHGGARGKSRQGVDKRGAR
jgi:hypothetical protein